MYENSVGPGKMGSAVRMEMGLEEALLSIKLRRGVLKGGVISFTRYS